MDLLFSLSGDERRRTVIVVTHDHGVARRAERVVRMHDGRVTSNGDGASLAPVQVAGSS
jgi:predicted ABC-type transport system involved in lysophospholipase L1 biosynthesis ATPase subunit